MEAKGYRALFWKIVCATLSFSLVPLFALGLSIYYQFSVSYTAKIMESLRTLAENRRDAIDLFLDERVSQLNTIAYTHSFEKLKQEEYLSTVFTLVQSRAKSFVDLGIIDGDGNHVAYVGPYRLRGLNYRNEEWFHEATLRGVYISDVFMGFRKYPHFIIAIMRREGDHHWILRATIDTEIFEGMVKAAQVGKSGDALVLNKDNVLQTKPRFGGELLRRVDYVHFDRFVGIRSDEMTIGGENALFAATWLRSKDWLLIIREDPSEELTPLFHARLLVIGLGVGGVLLIVAGTVFVARQMVGQLIDAEREKAVLDANLIQSSKMAALGKLAAGIAHEVNNPLAVIREKVGWIKDLLAEEDVGKSESFGEFVDAVRKIELHIDRAKKVTHRLLGFARRMEPIQEKVDINKLLNDTMDFLRNEAHYRNIQIVTDFMENLPQTISDSSQLQQVFLNIFNNAIDAIGKEGEIRVKTTCARRTRSSASPFQTTVPEFPTSCSTGSSTRFSSPRKWGRERGLASP